VKNHLLKDEIGKKKIGAGGGLLFGRGYKLVYWQYGEKLL
jgi:hypothetical protein